MAKRWKYSGDVNLEYGGMFWKEDGADDYVLAVRVTPCSDAGGPNNCYWIESGSIYIPADTDKRKQALSVIGETIETAKRDDLVHAFLAYNGIECETCDRQTIQIGAKQDEAREVVQVDTVLRGNTRLANYVRRECLQ